MLCFVPATFVASASGSYAPQQAGMRCSAQAQLFMKALIENVCSVPRRYGSPPAQFKAFWDSTGQLWQKGSLVGKTGGFFFSTATQGGGQETTAWTSEFPCHAARLRFGVAGARVCGHLYQALFSKLLGVGRSMCKAPEQWLHRCAPKLHSGCSRLPATFAQPQMTYHLNIPACDAAITQLVHHGMIYVPLGYTAANGVQFQVETAQVGFPTAGTAVHSAGTAVHRTLAVRRWTS